VSTEPDPFLGRRLGAYRIEEKLGGGGFGNVYRAVHADLGIDRAVKIMQGALAGQSEFRERFLHEAKMAARLTHPNIVPVYDYGLEGDTQYIVMAFVPAQTLERRLAARQPVPFEMATRLAAELASALDYAHGFGIVHRDIKPANVLLREPDGTAMLVDFGIARIAGERGLTQTGLAIGTFAYMSPEQCRGEVHELDRRSDIYSFTVMLFELVAGQVPYGDGPAAVAGHLSPGVPSGRRFNPYLPEAVDPVLGWGMAQEPERRPNSAGELVAALISAFGGAQGAFTPGVAAESVEPEPASSPELDLQRTVDIAREIGDRPSTAQGLHDLGRQARFEKRLSDARMNLEECLSIWRELGEEAQAAGVLFDLGSLLFDQGRHQEAEPYWEESLDIWRRLGETAHAASLLLCLGRLASQLGRHAEARQHCLESYEMLRQAGDAKGSARSLFQLGQSLDLEGRAGLARRVLAQSALAASAAGDLEQRAQALTDLARLAEESGQPAVALPLVGEALTNLQQLGRRAEMAPALAKLAELAHIGGQSELAVRLSGAAAAIYQALGETQLSEATRLASQAAVGALNEKVAWQAWTEGWSMPPEQTVATVIAQPRRSTQAPARPTRPRGTA
jgi:tetratricopeptide (TPR) repeat protein